MKIFDGIDDSDNNEESNEDKGLRDLIGDDNTKTEQDKKLEKLAPDDDETQKKYVQPSVDDFNEFFDIIDGDWEVVDVENTKELVYELPSVLTDDVTLRVYSTIDERTGKARDKGSDTIRTVIWDKDVNAPIGGESKTLRIKTWRSNLKKKIDKLTDKTDKFVKKCSECNEFMVKREGDYGEFLGCQNYPDCNNTEQLPEIEL